MPTRQLPIRPSFEHVRKQAKQLLKDLQRQNSSASLAEAQFQLAKEYGFSSWTALKQTLEGDKRKDLSNALEALREGKPIILFDDTGKEDEGDFVYAAEKITGESVNFLTKHARGTMCLAITPSQVKKLGLAFVNEQRESLSVPAFTASIDARDGVTSGVSAADRAKTIRTAIAEDATPQKVRSPGHIFPLCAVEGGMSERQGHTEGSIELMKRAGLRPAAVICEILNDDGSMARLHDVKHVAAQGQIPLVCLSQLL